LTSYTGKYCELSKIYFKLKNVNNKGWIIKLNFLQFFKESKGYSFNKSQVNFEYKSPLYWQQQNHLAFGIETTMKDATLFKSFNARNNETILVELVRVIFFIN
jgi:hypothetical protein